MMSKATVFVVTTLGVVIGIFQLPVATATQLDKSFSAPFLDYDHRGRRYVQGWKDDGSAVIKQGFVRLTADNPEETGAIWTRLPVKVDEFSAVLKFRMSGMEHDDHGQSLAMFFVESNSAQRPGDWFGYTEHFTGIGVIVDRGDPAKLGRDSSQMLVVVNDGTKNVDNMVVGSCTTALRYHEERDDFMALSASRIRVTYRGNNVQVEIDARNSGVWRRCSLSEGISLPAGWATNMRVGIVATTADGRTDNHDVFDFKLYDSADDGWKLGDGYNPDTPVLKEGETVPETDETAIKKQQFYQLMHHLDHELSDVYRRLHGALHRLEERRARADEWIQALETSLGDEMLKLLEHRVEDIEKRVSRNTIPTLSSRLWRVEREVHADVQAKLDDKVQQADAGWRYPFLGLLLVLVMFATWSRRQYSKIKKESIHSYGPYR